MRSPLAPDERVAGDTILGGDYRIVRKIGAGAAAVTYAAVEVATGAPVAVKELSLGRLRVWKQLELFEREAAVLQSLSHPAIPAYRDYREDPSAAGGFFLVQELADGPSLAALVRGGALRCDDAEVERIARELLTVLQYLASRRPPVIHRDIKPENIVLEGGAAGGRVRLVDFGGVQAAVSSAASGGAFATTVVGTAGYMPPEQSAGAAVPASDLYAVGGVLLFLVTGRAPGEFPAARLRVAWEGEVDVSPRLARLLRGLLEPIAEDRWTAAEALAVLDGDDVGEPSASMGDAGGSRERRGVTGGGALDRRYDAAAATARGARARLAARRGTRRGRRGEASSPRWESVPPGRPPGARARVSALEATTLLVEVPPAGAAGAAAPGAFALAWNVFVGVWTASALAGGGVLFALFSLPFWLAGARITRDAALGGLLRETLLVGGAEWSLTQELARLHGGAARFVGGDLVAAEGCSRDLCGARVVITMVANGEPRGAVELCGAGDTFRFAETLPRREQLWLAASINRHLRDALGVDVTVDNEPLPGDPFEGPPGEVVDVVGARGIRGEYSARSARFGRRGGRWQRGFDSWDDD